MKLSTIADIAYWGVIGCLVLLILLTFYGLVAVNLG